MPKHSIRDLDAADWRLEVEGHPMVDGSVYVTVADRSTGDYMMARVPLAQLKLCVDMYAEQARARSLGTIPATGQSYADYFDRDAENEDHADFLEAQERARREAEGK